MTLLSKVLITKLRSVNTVETRQYLSQYHKAAKALLVLIPLLGITYLIVIYGPDEGVQSHIFSILQAFLLSIQVSWLFTPRTCEVSFSRWWWDSLESKLILIFIYALASCRIEGFFGGIDLLFLQHWGPAGFEASHEPLARSKKFEFGKFHSKSSLHNVQRLFTQITNREHSVSSNDPEKVKISFSSQIN